LDDRTIALDGIGKGGIKDGRREDVTQWKQPVEGSEKWGGIGRNKATVVRLMGGMGE